MITVVDDFELPLMSQLNGGSFPLRYGWKSNPKISYSHWNHRLIPGNIENEEDQQHLLEHPIACSIWQALKYHHFSEKASLLRCYVNAHTFGTEGYPHKDSKRKDEMTAICYLVPEWKQNWAGATAVWDDKDEDIERAVMPKPGRLLILPSNRLHSALAISRICSSIRTTLIYKVRL